MNSGRSFSTPILFLALGLVAGSSIGVAYANGIITFDGDFLLNGDFFCDGCVDTPEIAEGAVDSLRILDGDVKSIDIGDGEVKRTDIGDFQVITSKIANTAVTSPKIADDAVGLSEIDITISTFTTSGIITPMIPVDGKSFCVLLKHRTSDSNPAGSECDIDFGGLSNWELQATRATCQAICIQFG